MIYFIIRFGNLAELVDRNYVLIQLFFHSESIFNIYDCPSCKGGSSSIKSIDRLWNVLKLFHSFQRKHSVCLFYIFRCRAFKDLLKVKRYKRMILQYVCRGSKIILGLEHMKYIFSCSFKKQRKYNSSWVCSKSQLFRNYKGN